MIGNSMRYFIVSQKTGTELAAFACEQDRDEVLAFFRERWPDSVFITRDSLAASNAPTLSDAGRMG
jgi:hypothetical protein